MVNGDCKRGSKTRYRSKDREKNGGQPCKGISVETDDNCYSDEAVCAKFYEHVDFKGDVNYAWESEGPFCSWRASIFPGDTNNRYSSVKVMDGCKLTVWRTLKEENGCILSGGNHANLKNLKNCGNWDDDISSFKCECE